MATPQREERSQQRPQKSNSNPTDSLVSQADMERILHGSSLEDVQLLNEKADEIGKQIKNGGVSVSQIRNFFGELRRVQLELARQDGDQQQQPEASAEGEVKVQLQEKEYRQLMRLGTLLRYQAARHQVLKPLTETIFMAIQSVGQDRKAFENFVDFVEAIVAYHRYYGGKNS